jgi:hypothetical protein
MNPARRKRAGEISRAEISRGGFMRGEISRSAASRGLFIASLCAWAAILAACDSGKSTAKSPETIAVEERAGDFLEYYGEVLRLSQEFAAHPDSFRAAIDSLPGSHLTEEEWEAWIAPYRDDPREISDRLEKIIAGLKPRS